MVERGPADARRTRRHWGGGGYFTVPNEMIDGGPLRELRRAELLVLLGLMRHADFATGRAWPGADRIAEIARLNRRTVERALRELENRGLIELIARGGQLRRANSYEMKNPGVQTGVSRRANPAAPDEQTPVRGTPNLGLPGRGPRSPDRPNRGTPGANQQNTTADDSAVANRLAQLGINEPTRSQLAAIPGLTRPVIDACLGGLSGSAGAGLCVNAIRERAPRLIAAADRREQQQKQRAAAQQKADDEDAALAAAIWEALPDAERERVTDQVQGKTHDCMDGVPLKLAVARHVDLYGLRCDPTPRLRAAVEAFGLQREHRRQRRGAS